MEKLNDGAALAAAAQEVSTSDKRLVTVLRQMIMNGELEAGATISEVRVSEMFDVSRTPARLALRTLEVEGLIKKRDGRGFTVQSFSFDDLSKAYEVRGVLEGLAAGTLARDGIAPETESRLVRVMDEMDVLLRSGVPIEKCVITYQEANIDFHETIMGECENEFIRFAFARLAHFPLLGLGTVVFNKDKAEEELMRLCFGNMQHRVILDAITRRDTFRAETLMREHANQIPVYTSLLVEGRPSKGKD
ncbi:MAG: GntR family transcriptional regulator [Pseudomonadota bacterium]